MSHSNQHIFDQDLELVDTGSRIFTLTISNRWSIGAALNGGYLLGVIGKAMALCSGKKATPIITANYISRCVPGETQIHVEVISESKNFTRLMARLIQHGKEKIRALGTFSSDPGEDVVEKYESGPPSMASFETSFPVPPIPDRTISHQIDLRFDPSCTGWLSNDPSGNSEFRGWVRFKQEREIDFPAILLFADAFPPPVLAGFGPLVWVPTIELSVNVRKIPETRVLQGIFKSRFISKGLVEEDGELWDTNGELIAISRQISKYRN